MFWLQNMMCYFVVTNISQNCIAKEYRAVKECGAGVLLKGSCVGYLLWERFNAFLTCRQNSEEGICDEKVWGAAKMSYALL